MWRAVPHRTAVSVVIAFGILGSRSTTVLTGRGSQPRGTIFIISETVTLNCLSILGFSVKDEPTLLRLGALILLVRIT
jgi:hypothetical protein